MTGSAGKLPVRRRARRTANSARMTSIPAAIVPARLTLGRGTVDDGDPMHDTAAHSLPDGAGASAVTMAARPAWRLGQHGPRYDATHGQGRKGHQQPAPPRCHASQAKPSGAVAERRCRWGRLLNKPGRNLDRTGTSSLAVPDIPPESSFDDRRVGACQGAASRAVDLDAEFAGSWHGPLTPWQCPSGTSARIG